MSSIGRLDNFTWVTNARNAGNPYAGPEYYPYKPIILLHMTVGTSLSRSFVEGHNVPPHLWANPYTGDLFQTVELDRAAFALYQPQFGFHWTNKHTLLLQTEIVGIPVVSTATYTDKHLRWIAHNVVVPQVKWLQNMGYSIDLTSVRYHADTSGSASENWPGRLSEQDMADFNGLMAHIDAWANDHWDCSAERLDLIAQYAIEELTSGLPTGDDKMDLILELSTGTVYARDGGDLFSISGQAELANLRAWGYVKGDPLPLADFQISFFRKVVRNPSQTPGTPVTVDYERIKNDVLTALKGLVLRAN